MVDHNARLVARGADSAALAAAGRRVRTHVPKDHVPRRLGRKGHGRRGHGPNSQSRRPKANPSRDRSITRTGMPKARHGIA